MAAVDVQAVAAEVVAQLEPLSMLGLAVLLVHVAILAFKWLRSVFYDEGSYIDDDVDEMRRHDEWADQYDKNHDAYGINFSDK